MSQCYNASLVEPRIQPRGSTVPSPNHNSAISQAVDSFLAEIARRYAAHTSAAYTQALHLFCRYLQQDFHVRCDRAAIHKLQEGWALAYLAHLQETRSVETEHLYVRTVFQFYEFVAERYSVDLSIDTLNQQIIENRRTKLHALPQLPSVAIQLMLEFAQTFRPSQPADESEQREYLRLLRDRAFLLTLADTGLRVSEICGLRRGSIHAESCELALGESFTLPLTSRAAQAIEQYLTARRKQDSAQKLTAQDELPLFARHDKRASKRVLPISRWTGGNIVDDWAKLSLPLETYRQLLADNQRITPHSFRHYFVFTILSQTDNLETARARARHGDSSTTRRYLRSLPQPDHTEPSS